MKKYSFLLLFAIFFLFPSFSAAENVCYLPESPGNSYGSLIKETRTETLIINNYLVIFFYYDVINPKLKDTYAKFNYSNIIKLAKMKWGKTEIESDDYFDKNGNTKPYIFVEVGGTIRAGWFKPINGFTRISTCFDYQTKNKGDEVSYYFIASYYEDIIDSINYLFTPLLTQQFNEER